ncbi:MAG: hypothetical protein BWY92_01616 [Firmicutes bacterium ADurb.BinA052]|nr:MAG: hypothetical protein BWY92_01616 [Firmicutes bacterium ADurb.BinA052]
MNMNMATQTKTTVSSSTGSRARFANSRRLFSRRMIADVDDTPFPPSRGGLSAASPGCT